MCGNKTNSQSDRNKINCQCDGNCNCGEILPNGMISCDNCGWKAPMAYNAASGNFACPSCRTESSFSSNNTNLKNKTMNRSNFTRGNINQGVVAAGIGMPGALMDLGGQNLYNAKFSGESNFANQDNSAMDFGDNVASQNMVGFAIGQSWMPMVPFDGGGRINESNFGGDLSAEDQQWADLFYDMTDENAEESGFGGRFRNAGLLRGAWSRRYCKALGYSRKGEDKPAFKRCVANVKLNFSKAKKGKWKYPAAPELPAEPAIDLNALAAESAKEIATMPPDQREIALRNEATDDAGTQAPAKSNTMMYVIIGAVALIIVVALIMFMRKKSATA